MRDYGRGIPLGKVVDVVSKMNTGGKYDSRAFKKSVGLNGVGTKAVNALSSMFEVSSSRENLLKTATFEAGNLISEEGPLDTSKRKGTKVRFIPDAAIFKNYKYRAEYVISMLKNYVYLNPGLTIVFNGEKYFSENGLKMMIKKAPSSYVVPVTINNSWRIVRFGNFPLGVFDHLTFDVHEPIKSDSMPFEELFQKVEKAIKDAVIVN